MQRSYTLNESDMEKAIAHWVQAGCPEPAEGYRVHMSLDRPSNPTPLDPGNGFSATLWVADVETP